jgi:gluconate 2-dehydrogenase gamma chain
MANQSPDRREILAMLAKIATLSQFPGFSRWVCASENGAVASSPRPSTYQPSFFTPAEYEIVEKLTGLILPADESPGAHEAGVAEFIDFIVAHDDELQYPFRTGLAWLNAFAFEKDGSNFSNLQSSQQEALLRKLAYRSQQSPTERQGQEFFTLIRKYTVLGYYTSRIGLESLDYPGLRFYSASPECPHQNDPEHKHLPAPTV